MLFMPLDDLQMVLAGEALTSFIDPTLEVLVSSALVIHCHLNLWFEGVVAHQLTALLKDVVSHFVAGQCSRVSIQSTQPSVSSLMVGHQTSTPDVAQQPPHTGSYIQVVNIGHSTLDVAWQSQPSSLA